MSDKGMRGPGSPGQQVPIGWPYAKDPNRPYDFGNQVSIPSEVHVINGRATVVRLDPRDPNYHLVCKLRKAG